MSERQHNKAIPFISSRLTFVNSKGDYNVAQLYVLYTPIFISSMFGMYTEESV